MSRNEYYNNPIISGFYPDPSICRVGEDYYLVNSSFEYFPAIPVWHSKDLVNWKQIGNAIDREEQGLDLDVNLSGGVQACTIRYHDGIFYITSTCVGKVWPSLKYNFIITATDPAGQWSKVHYIDDAPGIDSSLFFDDDGRAYFHANRQKLDVNELGDAEIWLQEIDLQSFQLIGEKKAIWDGTGGQFPEGPHIYKRNGFYYLLIAEGGTGHWHTTTFARATNIWGPYTPSPRNPILTHKHLSTSYPIQNVGHADIVETQNGEWYMVCLGVRPKGSYQVPKGIEVREGGHYNNLGRESFLLPIAWEDSISPIASPETGKVELLFKRPNLPEKKWIKEENSDFRKDLDYSWVGIRKEPKVWTTKIEGTKGIVLKASSTMLREDMPKSFIGKRQKSWNFEANTKLKVNHKNDREEFGIVNYFNNTSYIACASYFEDKKQYIKLECNKQGEITVICKYPIETTEIFLKVKGEELLYSYEYSVDGIAWNTVANDVDGSHLNSFVSGGHTGSFIGLYGHDKEEEAVVNIEYFEIKKIRNI